MIQRTEKCVPGYAFGFMPELNQTRYAAKPCKGVNRIAQGYALGSCPSNGFSPERAAQRQDERVCVSPLQGLALWGDGVPRALPWAGLLRPFGARAICHLLESLRALFVLRQSLQSNMMTVLAMKTKFQLSLPQNGSAFTERQP